MNLLAIETSSDACSVAVASAGRVFNEHRIEARSHTRELIPMIRRQLTSAGLTPGELNAVVLGNGPGSFIGMRIGASVAQGIAFAAGLPIVAVSSLAAVAEAVIARHSVTDVRIVQDARMAEVYCAEFRRSDEGYAEALGETRLIPAEDLAALSPMPLAGGAWSKHPALLEQLPAKSPVLPENEPDALFLLDAGRRALDAGLEIDPADLEPGYLRQTVAAIPQR